MDSSGFYQSSSSAPTSSFHAVANYPNPSTSETGDTVGTMFITNGQSNNPYQFDHASFAPSQESLLHPMSPELYQQLPSVQVTHPTPTKAMKFRRKSADALSVSTSSSFDPSPLSHVQLLPSPGAGTLDVMVEASDTGAGVSRSRPRSPDLEMEDDDSEAERLRLEERQARIREKGRERQRRKRERDKKAKESAQSKAASASSSHLPIPSNDQRTTSSQTLSISVPSPVSSIASSLPQSASYFSISPSHHSFGMQSGSIPVSGTSTPTSLFTPSTSTPGLAYSPETSMSASLFSLGIEGNMSSSTLDIPVEKPCKRITRGKTRAGSTSVSSSANSRKVSPTPLLTGLPQPHREGKPPVIKSAKRRKSEPQTDELFSTSANTQGLGVTTGQETPINTNWQNKSEGSTSRPVPRRTASDGIVIKSNHEREREWGARSPTPPPVPTLPSEYRQMKSLRPSPSTDTVSDAASIPSAQAEAFAARMVFLLQKDEGETGWLSSQIGLSGNDVEDMKNSLKGVYDRWLLEKGMKEMSLDSSEGMISSQPSSVNMTPSTTLLTHSSVPASPVINTSMSASGFFTPLPTSRTSSRRGDKRPTITVPIAESPSTSQKPTHTRQRSLSSASMMARGLHITSQIPAQPQQQWSHPATPTLPQEGMSGFSNDPKSDDTASPVNSSLQTPSTGQGSFPISEQMTTYHGHWRSATDPTGHRAYTTYHQHQQTPVRDQDINQNDGVWQVPNTCPPAHHVNQGQLDSPLTMTHFNKNDQMGMPPPSSLMPSSSSRPNTVGNNMTAGTNGPTVKHPEADLMVLQNQGISTTNTDLINQGFNSGNGQGHGHGHQRHFSTPVTSRTQPMSDRNLVAIPYTPVTPVPVRGQNNSTIDSGIISVIPMWYNQTFMSHNNGHDNHTHVRSQVLQSPIVERGHGYHHGANHSQSQDLEMTDFTTLEGRHGF